MPTRIEVFNKRRNPAVEEFAMDRLRQAIQHFDDRLGHIEVRISDENAKKGGVDKTCHIDAKILPHGAVHVHATAGNVREAIAKAAHRLDRMLAKTVDRKHRSSATRHQMARNQPVEFELPKVVEVPQP